MDVGFKAAINAYSNATNIANNAGQSGSVNSGGGLSGVFAGAVNNSVGNVANTLKVAEDTVSKGLIKQADITNVVSAVSDAELTLKTMVSVRDKLIAAYQEILRMPI